ncbi:MAG TPA: hypothetical protein VLC52_14750 [Anaerolineae bacterium]|nr:hypothetical protein [Anaerolineae bacterium]
MRRVLYAFVILALLAIPASAAFAVEPEQEIPSGEFYLGELVIVSAGGYMPGEPVDAWLYQPSTLAGWPLATQAAPAGSWWLPIGASEQRRWSYAETAGTPFAVADGFGIWSAILMLPRDEVWYPCSFPLKWKCNFQVEPGVWELHSPMTVNYIFPLEFAYLAYWPWMDIFGAAADPGDTVAPLEIDVFNYAFPIHGPQFEVVITGYDWKWTDINF